MVPFLAATVATVHSYAKHRVSSFAGLVQCSASASLLDIVNLLNSTRVHRIYVTDEQGQPSGVISLTDIFLTLKATS